MRITKVSYERLGLRLSTPYTIAYETVGAVVNFILKLETDSRLVGYGCAAPDIFVTGETAEEVEKMVNTVIEPRLKGANPLQFAQILEELKLALGSRSSSLAMVDMALHDIVARKAELPLFQLLGGYRNQIPTSVTVGILPVEDTLRRAREWLGRGFSVLKIKGGRNVEEDIEKLTRIREKYPDATLCFDGNQGYSVAETIAFMKGARPLGIQWLEQPTQVGEEDEVSDAIHDQSIPIMADESLKNLSDAFRLAGCPGIDMFNIKLMKVGGLLEAMHINSIAKAAGLEVMVGCLDECALGISAGLHFALSRPNVRYADLDGHLDLLEDPFQHIFHLEKGILYPTGHPGLGFLQY